MDDSHLQGQAEEAGRVSETGQAIADSWKIKECFLDRQAFMKQGKAADYSWHREQYEQETEMKLTGIEGSHEQHGGTLREHRVKQADGRAER